MNNIPYSLKLNDFLHMLNQFIIKINKCKHYRESVKIDLIDDSLIALSESILDSVQDYKEGEEMPSNPIYLLVNGRLKSPYTNKPYTSLEQYIEDVETLLYKCLAYTDVISEYNTINANKKTKIYKQDLKTQLSLNKTYRTNKRLNDRKGRTNRRFHMNTMAIPMNDPSDLNELIILITDLLCNKDKRFDLVDELIDITFRNMDKNLSFNPPKRKEIQLLENCISKIDFDFNDSFETEARIKLLLHILSN